MSLQDELSDFIDSEDDLLSKGSLSVVIQITETAQKEGLPLDASKLVTKRGGQVKGLGGPRIKRILRENGIDRLLASEGGRTSRGSIDVMKSYVGLLNSLHEKGQADLEKIQERWIQEVGAYFDREPFTLKVDQSLGIRAVVRALLDQAIKRQSGVTGDTTLGTVLQHLTGAKLEVALAQKGRAVTHNKASTSDQHGRGGDFDLGDVSIHVTTSPSDALMGRCKRNLDSGRRPLIVTIEEALNYAAQLTRQHGIGDRVDVLGIEQFVATNIYEIGEFDGAGRHTTIHQVIEAYNKIVMEYEGLPSLRIEPS